MLCPRPSFPFLLLVNWYAIKRCECWKVCYEVGSLSSRSCQSSCQRTCSVSCRRNFYGHVTSCLAPLSTGPFFRSASIVSADCAHVHIFVSLTAIFWLRTCGPDRMLCGYCHTYNSVSQLWITSACLGLVNTAFPLLSSHKLIRLVSQRTRLQFNAKQSP